MIELSDLLEILADPQKKMKHISELKAAEDSHKKALQELNLGKDINTIKADLDRKMRTAQGDAYRIIEEARNNANILAKEALDRDQASRELQSSINAAKRKLEEDQAVLMEAQENLANREADLIEREKRVANGEAELQESLSDFNNRLTKADEIIKSI